MSSQRVLCYNKCCVQKDFDPQDNGTQSCTFHPGEPVFHDAYKMWSCCKRKSTDFTEFLNFAGCTTGPHSNVKPPEKAKPQAGDAEAPEPVREPVREARIRPPADAPLLPLKVQVTNGLLKKLESLTRVTEAAVDDENTEIAIGTPCYRTGCRVTFDGSNQSSNCVFHSGTAIFHEGMKYWSCCQRKTSDFNNFLEQEGCENGKHVWRKPKVRPQDLDKSTTCKLDWYQTGDWVVVSVYSKLPIPTESAIIGNGVKLNIRVAFGSDRQEFEKEILLFGIVDVSESSVSFKETKVEISLKKDELVSWSRISF